MRDFLNEIRDRVLVFDGSKGTMLQKSGMKGGECPELWNITHSEEVKQIYLSYKNAGSDVIQTNTFQGNRLKLEEYGLGDKTYELNFEGARLAREVMGEDGFVAASIGPIGKLFEPSGELSFETAYRIYREQVKAVADGGADIINFETFTDAAEMRAALLAAKEETDLPVICSIAFEANGRTLMGTDPYTAAVILKSLGADMIGTNCSFGPEHLLDIIRTMSDAGGIYLAVKPNAGLPEMIDGEAVYRESPEKFAELAGEFVKCGVRLIGGCCGTTPEFIRSIRQSLRDITAPDIQNKCEQVITSGVRHLSLEKSERLNISQMNACEDEEFLNELKNNNMDAVVDKALELSCEGCDAVYINVDSAKGDENLLASVVNTAQGYIKEPFIIETSDASALSNALRIYKGKAGIIVNDVDTRNMESLLLAARKYGSTILDKSIIR